MTCKQTGCNAPESECSSACLKVCPPCNQNCNQGRDCPSGDMPIQFADEEPAEQWTVALGVVAVLIIVCAGFGLAELVAFLVELFK